MGNIMLIGFGIAILLSITAIIIGAVSRYKKNHTGYCLTYIGLFGLVCSLFILSNFYVGIVY